MTFGLETRVVAGRDWIEERVAGVTLLGRLAFFQTNTRMTDTLYARVAERAGLDGSQVLYDLFAGVGSIGIVLAAGAREVVAIEIVPEAVEDAIRNARVNGITNHTGPCGDVGVVLRERWWGSRVVPTSRSGPPRGLVGLFTAASARAAHPRLRLLPRQATFADNAARFGGGRLHAGVGPARRRCSPETPTSRPSPASRGRAACREA